MDKNVRAVCKGWRKGENLAEIPQVEGGWYTICLTAGGKVIRIFPNVESALRLIGAVLVEKDEDWSTDKRYLNLDAYLEWKKLAQEGAGSREIQTQAA